MIQRYKSPEVSEHRDAIKKLIRAFIWQVAGKPGYNSVNVTHDCVVYVMANLPNGVQRVDGTVLQPLIHEVVIDMTGKARSKQKAEDPLPPPQKAWLVRLAETIVAAASVAKRKLIR